MSETVITPIRRALLSVSDKAGLVDFATFLSLRDVELISTGGTAKTLREGGLEVVDLSTYTGFPEMLDGRVKTLHPKVHGGLLFIRGHAGHESTVADHGIKPIDLVVVNLYPFEQTVARLGVTLQDAIENIDIGGPSMLRSAAKNHEAVTVVVNPARYREVRGCIEQNNGSTTLQLRKDLALEVFERTASYDSAIADFLREQFRGGYLWPNYPTRSSILHSQMTGKVYPQDFATALKTTFTGWTDLHKALDEGDFAVGALLDAGGRKYFPPTPEDILHHTGEKHVLQIRFSAMMAIRALQFYQVWMQVVEPWRDDATNWPAARDIKTFFTTDSVGRISKLLS